MVSLEALVGFGFGFAGLLGFGVFSCVLEIVICVMGGLQPELCSGAQPVGSQWIKSEWWQTSTSARKSSVARRK